ncbi:MAG: hypothetical protein H7X77_08120 [Anaerolineae bacterium]|nr:hypothetical protein [Anaerolineae bacterium]
MKSVLDLYRALMQRKLEVAEEINKTEEPKASNASTRQTQSVPAVAAVGRSRRTDMHGFQADYEHV